MAKKRVVISDSNSGAAAAGTAPAKAEKPKTTASKTSTVNGVMQGIAAKVAEVTAEVTAAFHHHTSEPADLEMKTAANHQEIAKLAYLYWEARGYQSGSAESDWARAEADLKQRT